MLRISNKQKIYLSIASEIFQERSFIPEARTDRHQSKEIKDYIDCFYELISYFDLIGICVHVEKSGLGYEITSIDFFNLKMPDIIVEEYRYAVLYACLYDGVYLSKDAISNYLNEELSSNDMVALKKIFKNEVAGELIKTKDNRYTIAREGNNDGYRKFARP